MTDMPDNSQRTSRRWFEQSFEDLLATPRATPEVVAQVRHELGLDSARRVRYPDRELPDVSGLREALGV